MDTTFDENSRYFSVPFARADIKYNILGTLFFEDNIQNINIQDFTLDFKYQSKTHPNYAKFTTLLSKDYPYFSYIYRINSKTQIRLNPKSCKIAHFPIKNYHTLHFTTTPQNHFFPSVPHTYFANKFRKNFNFIEVFTDDKPDICATIIENTSKHVATLPTGHIGYIQVPITIEKPKFFQVNDTNTLIHNVTHTYHPEITEPVPQTNYNVHYDDPQLFSLDFHNFLKVIPPILLASILNTLLDKTNLLLQILYALLFEYVFHSDCSKLFLTNFLNTLIQVSKIHRIHSHNIITFHLLKNGFPFSYMIVLNVNAINTST